jgi:hypothetical protein
MAALVMAEFLGELQPDQQSTIEGAPARCNTNKQSPLALHGLA